MNKTLGFELIVYGVLLAGLSYLTHHLAPALARPTLIAGLAGGALCVLWGVLALLGSRRKVWAMLTLIPISFVMLSQTVTIWMEGTQDAPGRRTAGVVITAMLVFSIGMLMMIAYAGAVFDGQPAKPTNPELAKPQTPGKPGAKPNAIQRP